MKKPLRIVAIVAVFILTILIYLEKSPDRAQTFYSEDGSWGSFKRDKEGGLVPRSMGKGRVTKEKEL